MENEDTLYGLPKGQRNARCFQQGVHSPIFAFSAYDKVFWLVAGIVHSEKKKPNRIAKQTTEAMHGEYKWDKRSVVEFR
jgi:hypothetical protein